MLSRRLSLDEGYYLPGLASLCGMQVVSRTSAPQMVNADFGGFSLSLRRPTSPVCESIGAEVLAKDGKGSPIFFRNRFSTKCYDAETGLCYHGYRFYHPILMRWLNRDPPEEEGGPNLYAVCANALVFILTYWAKMTGLSLWKGLAQDGLVLKLH